MSIISKLPKPVLDRLRAARDQGAMLRGRLHVRRNSRRAPSGKGNIVLLSLGGGKGSPYVARAVANLGYNLVVACKVFPRHESRYARKWLDCDPFGDYDQLLAQVREINPVAVLVEQRNILLPIKAKLVADLGLRPYGHLSFKTSNSKIELRRAVDKAGEPNISWSLLSDYVPGKVPFPFVLKPETGTGSRGITIVESAADLDTARRRLEELADDETVGGDVFLEAVISGRQFDVEGIYIDGKPHALSVTEEHYDKVGNALPSAWYLFSPPVGEEVRARIIDAAFRFTKALGCINGAFHCEMRMNGNGELFVIDYANRMGYPHLVSECAGKSFPEAYVLAMAGEPQRFDQVKQGIVFQEYIREQAKYDRYRKLVRKHPELVIQQNMVPFRTAGVPMLGRVAIRSASFETLMELLREYDIVPPQWPAYYGV